MLNCYLKHETRLLNFYDDYSLMVSEAKNQAKEGKAKNQATKGTELKILTAEQILKRLPIAAA